MTAPDSNPRRVPGNLIVLGGYLALTVALTYPLITQFTSAIPGDGFDGWQNFWNLWWVRVALLEHHTHPFFTHMLYAPTGVGLLFHTLNPFNGITMLPVQVAFGLFPAYNAAAWLGFVLGGLGAYLLARRLLGPRRSRLPAFVGGIVFAFSPFHFAHLLGHMQVMSLQWLPFFALYLLRTVDGVKPRGANVGRRRLPAEGREVLLAAFYLGLVALCDWYYVLYCLILTAVVAGWRLAVAMRRRLRPMPPGNWVREVAGMAAIWIIWGGALSPLLLPMIHEARQFRFMVPDPAQSRMLSADLLAFITPQEFHPLWGAWAQERARVFTASLSEHTVFAGYTTLILAAVGLYASRRLSNRSKAYAGRSAATDENGRAEMKTQPSASVRAHLRPLFGSDLPDRWSPAARFGEAGLWLLILLVFFVLALGPVLHVGGRSALLPGGGEIPLPYGLIARSVPFMEITRSVSRFDVMVMLALAMLAAIGASVVNQVFRRGSLLTAALAALLVFEFLPVPYPLSPPDTPAWYNQLASDPRPGAVLNLPMNWDRPGYLLYQTVHRKPLTVAYISRNDPRTLTERAPVLQHFRHLGPDIIAFDLVGQGQQILADLGVRWVVLDRYKMPGGEERSVTEAFAMQIFGGQAPVYQDERITVYEVSAGGASAPYLMLGVDWEPFASTTRSRSFRGAASVIVHAPVGGEVNLRVTLAPDSPPLDAPLNAGTYRLALTLERGENVITLRGRSAEERVTVVELRLE